MAAGVFRVVFVCDLAFGVAEWTACFTHFLSAVRSGIRAVTNVVLLASGFSPLGVDAHTLLSLFTSRPARST